MNFASEHSQRGRHSSPESRRVLGVVPARLESSRLPRKPLQDLLGRPLVAWAAQRAASMSILDDVVVATDAEEIVNVCRSAGVPAVMTSPDHPSGTDRVAEVARMERYADCDIVVNLQGDEPLMAEDHVRAAVDEVHRGRDVGTCATPVATAEAWANPSVVKVVRREDGTALYFSRASIPAVRDGAPASEELAGPPFLRHLGLYAYRRDALLRWVGLPPSTLEKLEKLEQLRALEAGMSIGVAVVSTAEQGVDTQEDLERVEERMRELGLSR